MYVVWQAGTTPVVLVAKFVAGVVDTGGKFTTGVIATGGAGLANISFHYCIFQIVT